MDPSLAAIRRKRLNKLSHGTAYRQGGHRRVPKDDGIPGILPYILLGGACICALSLPVYLLLQGGMPEPTQTFFPPTHGSDLISKSVADYPIEGEHFTAGELVKEGRALGEIHEYTHTVVEFTDFFCPHCQEAHINLIEPLIRHYVPKGTVRIESHPVAFLADQSLSAAHAALCGQEQHKYWEVRELLFQVDLSNYSYALDAEDMDVFNAQLLKRIGKLASLDMYSFAKCFSSGRHRDEVRRISQLARDLNIHATPSFLINHKRFEGLEWSELTRLLEVKPRKPPGHVPRLPKMPVDHMHPKMQQRAQALQQKAALAEQSLAQKATAAEVAES
mmetsp:Transcript_11898/g.20090  ORF Transcript_11898/g.20090 Transcript_11898/m.20090 type:complete len:333 (-) Transcript_11898:44-1042(-)|eukprot:CAMPEP_0198216166 /NCGR_PEP_ID=MMETSP1445-20131203/55505_1 /TAXON_ID=36898 /ORGANISM="Pyramimonas sp., Strain CCMP2087" /LENGTH=332 /DNA_ID=CAMNT_0043892279 /DNA_START=268 /DNA_END=1266 /DNA_ORIENTATION=+